VHVQAVVGDVEFTVDEPAVVRRARFVQRDAEGLVPAKFVLRLARPEALVIGSSLGLERGDVFRLEAGVGGELGSGWEASFFDENGFDVLTHGGGV